MRKHQNRRRRITQAAMSMILGLVTACAEPTTPVSSNGEDAPVVSNGTSPIVARAPPASVKHEPRYIVIAHGQALERIARHNHVSPAALAAANHLEPPYKLREGSRLLVPESEQPETPQAQVPTASPTVPIAAPTPATTEPTLPTTSGVPPVLPPRYAPAALPLPGEVVGSH